MSNGYQQPQLDRLAITLIGISSLLLGIWAVKHTIALRNILLVLGVIASLIYCAYLWYSEKLKDSMSRIHAIPYLCIGLSLIWVVMHWIFFSKFPDQQFDELNSTWLRAALATIVGCGTGFVLQRWQKLTLLLWIGILLAFLVLFSEYIPKAISKNAFFAPDYFGYLFYAKFNGVLMGILCMTGLGGYFLDNVLRNQTAIDATSRSEQEPNLFSKTWIFVVTLLIFTGIALITYSFVFILDSRNGIGLAFILFGIWCLIAAMIFLTQFKKSHSSLKKICIGILILFAIGTVLFNFATFQNKVNKGWQNFIEDFKVAAQIDRYTHWQNPKLYGYPQNALGQTVTINNYERVAWGLVGLREIWSQPLGAGVLHRPYIAITQPGAYLTKTDDGDLLSTHSAWIELGLAFGPIYLGLIMMALLSIAIIAIRSSPQKMTVVSFVVMILILYLVGEATPKHGIEILYYFLGLLAALAAPQLKPINTHKFMNNA